MNSTETLPSHEDWIFEARDVEGAWHAAGPMDDAPPATSWRVVCACGWTSEPEEVQGGAAAGSQADGSAQEACWEQRTAHLAEIRRPDPSTVLIESRDGGGLRHFLAGRAVHGGTGLELQIADGRWVRGRYEWSFRAGAPAMLHIALALPEGVDPGQFAPPTLEVSLPAAAILRRPD